MTVSDGVRPSPKGAGAGSAPSKSDIGHSLAAPDPLAGLRGPKCHSEDRLLQFHIGYRLLLNVVMVAYCQLYYYGNYDDDDDDDNDGGGGDGVLMPHAKICNIATRKSILEVSHSSMATGLFLSFKLSLA